MQITLCTKADYDQIVTEIREFWGSDRTLGLHHPMLIYEFGDTAYVIKEGNRVVAYLFGFFSQTEPTAYVHLIGVRKPNRRRGLARRLYEYFMEFARHRGCTELKAITNPANKTSIAFHKSLGMTLIGGENREGVPVIKNYSGPGQDRVVFLRQL